MENKVQEIAEKIYREGVEKGQEEAQKIIAQAEAEKVDLLHKAQIEAEKIVTDARKQAETLAKNTKSELSLYAARAAETLKSKITDLMTDAVAVAAVKETVTREWLQQLILTIATRQIAGENITIRTSDAETLKQYFAQHAKNLLDEGVKIEQVNGKPSSFIVVPADGTYKIQFGDDEFAAFFKDFIRPQLAEMLFK
ncbi:MAG: hypothetical protein LBS09_02730 [Bacteroidales bacterium]|jgi:V/A-type H+-transporting ATPase subunit E|nr:hypothetical protein [Bacteroidales bacterium]